MNNLEAKTSSLTPAILISVIASFIANCRPSTISRIEEIAGELETNCGELLDDTGSKISKTEGGIKVMGSVGSYCSCEDSEIYEKCHFVKPGDEGAFFAIETSKNARSIRANRRTGDVSSEAHMGLAEMKGEAECIQVGELSRRVGVNPEVCAEFLLATKQRIEVIMSQLKSKTEKK